MYFIVYFQIEALSLKYLSIFTISPQAFEEDHTNLRELSLSRNLLDEVPTDALAILHKLQKLDLSFNNISIIRNGSFLNLSSLTELILTGNQLHTIEDNGFSGVKSSLRYLRLNKNPSLKGSPQIAAFPQLSTLDLSQCSLGNLTMALTFGYRQISLSVLNLKNNNIHFIDPIAFQNADIKYLYLDDNHIQEICSGMFVTLKNMYSLYLSKNKINVISQDCFRNMSSLKVLDLSSNNLSRIINHAFIRLPNLLSLKLDDNTLNSLDVLTFVGLKSLTSLHLFQNQLDHISISTFQYLPKLRFLNLKRNLLLTLTTNVFDENFLNNGVLYIDGNPFNCDCGLVWFREHPFRINSMATCFSVASNQSFSLKTFPLYLCLNESMRTNQTLTNHTYFSNQETSNRAIPILYVITICSCLGLIFIITVIVAVIRRRASSGQPMDTSHPAST